MVVEFDHQLFDSRHIAVVRPSGLNKEHCIIFTAGQSAVDGGFLVKVPYNQVARKLREARMTELVEMADLLVDDIDEEETEQEDEEDENDEDATVPEHLT